MAQRAQALELHGRWYEAGHQADSLKNGSWVQLLECNKVFGILLKSNDADNNVELEA